MTVASAGPRPTDAAESAATPPGRARRRLWPWLISGGVLMALAALGFLAAALVRTSSHEVPPLVGRREADVARLTEGLGWDIEVERARSDAHPDPGEIIRTSPTAGDHLAEGEPLLIVVSDGPELRVIPELAGQALSAAETALAERDLVALPAEKAFDEDVPVGEVVSWSVPGQPALGAGAEVPQGTEVALVVSAGPAPRLLPDLSGMSVVEATAQLEYRKLAVTLAEPAFSDTVPIDRVISMAPAQGTTVERGTTVVLTPSKGVDLVALPDLRGQSLPQIHASLAAAGLQIGALLGSTQGTFEAASVRGEDADLGDEFRRGTPIDLVVL